MCLDAAVPHRTDAQVVFLPCGQTTQTRQQWSRNGLTSGFEGTVDGWTLDGYCMNAPTPQIVGSRVTLLADTDEIDCNFWGPEATVGDHGRGGAARVAVPLPANGDQPPQCGPGSPDRPQRAARSALAVQGARS
jgi:hypothetical protein